MGGTLMKKRVSLVMMPAIAWMLSMLPAEPSTAAAHGGMAHRGCCPVRCCRAECSHVACAPECRTEERTVSETVWERQEVPCMRTVCETVWNDVQQTCYRTEKET